MARSAAAARNTASERDAVAIPRLTGVKNGGFEEAPPFTAVQTVLNWIDGTAAGSTTNDRYKWFCYRDVPAVAVSYDSTVYKTGAYSLKVSTTDATGRARIFTCSIGVTLPGLQKYGIPLQANTSYTLSGWVKTNNCVNNTVGISIREYDAAGTLGVTSNSNVVGSTVDWTQVSVTFTTAASAVYGVIILLNTVAGNVSDAWFDDIRLTPIIRSAAA